MVVCFVLLLFNSVGYVFLLLCLCILTLFCIFYTLFCIFCFHCANWHSLATLTEVFLYFFLSCKANARVYMVLPKISENLNIPCKPLALRTRAARCLSLYLSTNSLATGVFISARVSEFWLFSLHHFHECLRISKWRELRSKELALNFASG